MTNPRNRVLSGLVALATTAGATLATAPPATAAPAAAGTGAHHQVTLITGDTVRASQRADGRWRLAVDPVAGGKSFDHSQFPVTRGGRTDWYLVPHQAERLVSAGLLDRELFNITGLIWQGFDDARSKEIPLLVQYPEGTARARELRGASTQRELPDLGLAAVREKKSGAAGFWRELTHQGPATLSGGARKVWLNGRVQSSLDRSVPQVGAPAAWQAGFTGKGVTVAVLDTGIDDKHPDVAGKVKHSKDFSGKGNVVDGNGHGTHVAATAVGSGAADGGRFKGVAPEAELAIGKVLDDSGRGSFDDMIAGMRWAAAEVKAKVVNMSVGGRASDGTDPVSQALNTLSRQHGTLFVVAAGNEGEPRTVSTPASADLALAVGSVTKTDRRSEFSSQGPREGDGAVKPEISAPGSDIVAARAAGTALGTPVNEHYTRASGTSMATPHVAGGAALLVQQHPDWTPEQLKSALVSAVVPLPGNGVFTVGSGRLDLAKAVRSTVLATPAAVNAFLKWPSTKAQTRTITYTNQGNAPITLTLKLDLADTNGAAAPANLATLSANTVTVPAGGKAEVTVSLTPRAAKQGSYGGVLTATDGTTGTRTLIGGTEEGEHHDVSAQLLRRDGKPGTENDSYFELIRLQDGTRYTLPPTGAIRVPGGSYTALGWIRTPVPGSFDSTTLIANPELKIDRPARLSFDARQGKRVSISADQPSARGGRWQIEARQQIKDTGERVSFNLLRDPQFSEVYAYSTAGVSSPTFSFSNSARLEQREVELIAEEGPRTEFSTLLMSEVPDTPINTALSTVHGGAGTAEDLAKVEVKGKFVVIALPGLLPEGELEKRVRDIKAAGGVAVAYFHQEEQATRSAAQERFELPTVEPESAHRAKLAEYARAGGRISLLVRTHSEHRYELAFPAGGKIPAKLEQRVRTADLAKVTSVYHGYSKQARPEVESIVDGPGGGSSAGAPSRAVHAAERVEHFTPGDWEMQVSCSEWDSGLLAERLRLEAGRSYRQEWNKAVHGPALAGTTSSELGKDHPWAWVKGNLVDVTVPWFSDAAGHSRVSQPDSLVDKGSTVLYRDGQEAGRSSLPGQGTFRSGYTEQYRLEAEVSRDAPWWPTSTRVTASWTFPAPEAQTAPLPLLSVRYAPPVDLRNLAPGGREFAIPVTVLNQNGKHGADSLTVEYSVDEGANWQQARLEQAGAGWTATVSNPVQGFVSLRAKASAGKSSVEQTVAKAYQIG